MSPVCDTPALRSLQSIHHHTVFQIDSGTGTDHALTRIRKTLAYLTDNSLLTEGVTMKKQILSAVFITVISSVALAEDSVAVPFNDLDRNNDNILSAAEASTLPEIATQWNDLDKNGDGKLSRDEYSAYQLPAPAAGAS
jgi:hypothetical protein